MLVTMRSILQPATQVSACAVFFSVVARRHVVAGHVVSATIENTGAVAGAEVAQLFLRFPETAGEPFRLSRSLGQNSVAYVVS